jgi:hypothetical protein
MTYKRFKIYPSPLPRGEEEKPKLDPSKAPWSSPRGFATSIPEEVAAYKRSLSSQHPQPQPLRVRKHKEPKQKQKCCFSCKNLFKKAFLAIYNHFQAITFSEERHDHINERMHRFIGYFCCIPTDVGEAIRANHQLQERNINSPQSL